MKLTIEQQKKVSDELTPIDAEMLFDEMLYEIYGDVEIAGMIYETAETWRTIDPTAYRCAFNDWIDSEEKDERIIEVDGEYYSFDEVKTLIGE